MPLPIFVPFLIKGAIVAGKVLLSKGAVTKSAVMVTKAAAAKYGAAHTAAAIATGLVCVGGVAWTAENVGRARRAYDNFSAGDYPKAASELAALATSIKTVGTTDFTGDLGAWLSAGTPIDQRFFRLLREGKALADEAAVTLRNV